ncbi:DEAD/DEAH box helicase [Trinickia sp.]|uniref:DEAD/DEAH box helicase n=1 Tax=Trinickia sp. TaxID=2571163 RepID=UPI003F7DBA58
MTQAETLHDILDFWHKVEFFIPFDLKQVFDKTEERDLKWLKPEDFRPGAPSPWQVDVPADRELTGFTLYLGVFDMQFIADFARTLSASGATNPIEETERTALEGKSCIARVSVDAQGQSEFDPVSISTVPWAIGTAKTYGLQALTSESFAQAKGDLSERLFNYKVERLRSRPDIPEDGKPFPLTGDDILSLHAVITDWTGCAFPPQSSIALCQIRTREKREERRQAADSSAAESAESKADATSLHAPESLEEEDEEEITGVEDEPTVDILNSFYIEDIERCMASLRNGDIPATIHAYLMPAARDDRIDLYTDAGRAQIIRALHPTKTNSGHWPEDPARAMSLMQQFAINTALERLQHEGMSSVNGPPGTGKTTLLRDMICENVVRRARELAKLPNAADALANTGTKIHFGDSDTPATIRVLRPELTGFEMVVASSNNAAVENISTDLPKRKRLGEMWRDVRYLQPVAHKVAAQVGEKRMTKLAASDVPWGMISCALGNATNRRRFRERFFDDWRPANERGRPGDPCTIRDWLKQYSGPTFELAKRTFLDADSRLQSAIDERLIYAALNETWRNVSEEQFTRSPTNACAEGGRRLQDALSTEAELSAKFERLQTELEYLREEERLLDRSSPGVFSKLFRTKRARQHAAETGRNARSQIDMRRAMASSREELSANAAALRHAQLQADAATEKLSEARATWRSKHAELEMYCKRFGTMKLPEEVDLIETDTVQKDGYWQDAELARLRTETFVAALTLHEAWLAEVAQLGGVGFGGNLFAISKLLKGIPLENPADARFIWESFFMVVPVVSTTFASFARQFRGMGPRSIGWLFIDEAGQAVPQAAVGALWRARRAMVVGDPLQIEPVFTVPTQLINALADLSPHTSDKNFSPNKVSVQRLADDANPFGVYMPNGRDERLWIGSPLRVHRRCADPMFSIANKIAYQDKMVYGLESRDPPQDKLGIGNSAWVDVRGKTSQRQVVPAQIDAVSEFIVRIYAKSGKLPPLYVISPFKAVKAAMAERLRAIDWRKVPNDPPAKKLWERWCQERVGTVHTFQGKEESIVIFVLGADCNNAGSASWAASTPNLLNVALTRAQHRVFIVGDVSLWGGLKNFSQALHHIKETVTAEQWLGRVGTSPAHGWPDTATQLQ